MGKLNTARYIEANRIATEKTNRFVENIDHGQSNSEIKEQYENEICRLNRELLLTAMEAASIMKIQTKDLPTQTEF